MHKRPPTLNAEQRTPQNAPKHAPTTPRRPTPGRRPRAESRGQTVRSYPFTSKWFHVLLNSLFKVLFNFPSRYLSSIGLVQVFSLRWSLPPTLGCIYKQPDSKEATSAGRRKPKGLTPAMGKGFSHKDRVKGSTAQIELLNTTVPSTCRSRGFGAGLFPLHSPLLRESWLVSFPPLINMLKFSG